MKLAVLALVLALPGCSHQVKVALPQVETKTQFVYVAVPDELTTPFDLPERKANTVPAIVDAYNARGETIRECNARLQKIRFLGIQP